MNDFTVMLNTIDSFIYKMNGALHKHGPDKLHNINLRHTRLRNLEPEIFDLHRNNIPHIHEQDRQIINAVKQKLATNIHNKKYWQNQGSRLIKRLESWHDLINDFPMNEFVNSLDKFHKEAGFDIEDIKKQARIIKGLIKNRRREEAKKEILNAQDMFKKFMATTFGWPEN